MKKPNRQWPPVPSSRNALDLGGDPGPDMQNAGGAKNLWVSTDHQNRKKKGKRLRVMTYNVRTLKHDARVEELRHELEDIGIKWDIIGLAETRRQGERLITLNGGHILYHTDAVNGQQGVGFLINRTLSDNIIEVKQINPRLATLKLKINGRYTMKIIQVYMPTTNSSDEEVSDLYDDITEQLQTDSHYIIVMGDFNAKVGIKVDQDELAMGKFGSGERNERGRALVNWTTENKLKIMNTYYKKRSSRRWTWQSPDGNTKNEIDYIITNRVTIFRDVRIINRLNIGSDHRTLMGDIEMDIKRERRKLMNNNIAKIDIQQLIGRRDEFEVLLENRFKALQDLGEDKAEERNTQITNILQESTIEIAKDTRVYKSKLSGGTKGLIKKRRSLKKAIQDERNKIRNNIEYVELDKTVKKKIREDIRKHNMNLVEKAIRSGGSIKKTRRTFALGRDRMVSLLDRDGLEITDQDKIIKRIEEFYGELYKSTEEVNIETANTSLEDITEGEIEATLKKMKNGKATGNDDIKIETMKAGGSILIRELAKLFTDCLKHRKIPTTWKNARMIIIFKKGNRKDIKNYRPICLLSNLYKLYTKILTFRLSKDLDAEQPREQAGFRSHYSTTDHLHAVNQLREKCQEYNIPLCVAFIDYEKAFDSVETSAILKALKYQGIDHKYIEILKDIYTESTVTVKTHKHTGQIKIQKGVRQGDTISPKLFTAVLEDIMRKMDWRDKGINIDGERLNHLRFADDIIITSSNAEEMEMMMRELAEESRKCGLKMNTSKTKVMFGPMIKQKQVEVSNNNIEAVEEYIYLGQRFSLSDRNQEKEIQRRISAGWGAFAKHKDIMKSNMPVCLKRKVYNTCVIPAMTYGAEAWTLTEKMENNLAVAQRKMERRILGISYRDRKTNLWVRSQTNVKDILVSAKEKKWRWAGHVSRMRDNRWTIRMTEWTPRNGKRSRGRPNRRWRDELDEYWKTSTWGREAQDRNNWFKHAEAFVQQWNIS